MLLEMKNFVILSLEDPLPSLTAVKEGARCCCLEVENFWMMMEKVIIAIVSYHVGAACASLGKGTKPISTRQQFC